jgi:hypothetical protein
MTLTEALQLREKYLQWEDLRALDYCEKRWQQDGCPTERWQIINFLERMLRELQANGTGYPKVLLLRKKEIQRNAFVIATADVAQPAADNCAICKGQGWKTSTPRQPSSGYVPCECSAGDTHRKRLSAWGMLT